MPKSSGLAETSAPYKAAATGLGSVKSVRLKIGEAGRIVIPAEMREAMLIKAGDTVTARVVDGELHVISPRTAISRFHEATREWREANPAVDLVAELIADRREEARAEAKEADTWRSAHGLPALD